MVITAGEEGATGTLVGGHAKHIIIYKIATPPTYTKSYLAPNVNGAETEKLWDRCDEVEFESGVEDGWRLGSEIAVE